MARTAAGDMWRAWRPAHVVGVAVLLCAAPGAALAQAPASEPAPATSPVSPPSPAATSPVPPAPAMPPPSPAPAAAPQQAPAAAADTGPDAGIPAVVIDGQKVESILGKRVRSSSGEDMGRIVDVIVDKAGQIRAAIIDFGGFLGVGTRQIAVDWRALRFPSDQKAEALTVDLTRDQLRVAPVYKAGEQIVVLGRPRPDSAAAAPRDAAQASPAATSQQQPPPPPQSSPSPQQQPQ